MNYKPLPIGIENFEKMIKGEYYYVDKTWFIKELIDKKGEVNLFTRPRRFGKTLNMSMLQYFFEKTEQGCLDLFKGLKIMETGEKYTSQMNQYPVISLTLKGAAQSSFLSSFEKIKDSLIREFKRHRYLLESTCIDEDSKVLYKSILSGTAEMGKYSGALQFLSECLEEHYDRKVIILVDEYDVPLENAYFKGFYTDMADLIRTLFSDALKTNNSLYFAVLTGCLRISKESIFTGLNNFKIISITSTSYGEYFGFVEDEVEKALCSYQLTDKKEEVRNWYNGYAFGEINIYNPWSIINYLYDTIIDKQKYPIPSWSNTSSNSIIRDLIEVANEETKGEIEYLIRGGSVTKPIHEDIVYSEIRQSMDNLWNFLFFTGYLKKTEEIFDKRIRYFTLKIPNEEIRYIYERKIREWFDEKVKIKDTSLLLKAIQEKDTKVISEELNGRLMDMISFHDSAESFYHGFLLGILSNIQGYQIKSNRESGKGRSDIFMKTTGISRKAVIFECKVLGKKEDAEEKCKEALKQIEEKKYEYDLIQEGYKDVLKYGIVFRGKECMVMGS